MLRRVEYDHLWSVGIFQSLQCLNEKKKKKKKKKKIDVSYCLNASVEEML